MRENHLCDFEHLLGSEWKFFEDENAVGSCRTICLCTEGCLVDKEFDLSYELPRDYDLSIMLTKTFCLSTSISINYIYYYMDIFFKIIK